MIMGIGSVTDAGTASLYLQLGANFVVTPVLRENIAVVCDRKKILWSPGCASLTEIARAEELGCEIVKLFPGSVYGPGFVIAIKGPQLWTSSMPAGGVAPTEKTCYGFLAPPTLRDKDRCLRIFNILNWVVKIDGARCWIDAAASQRLDFIDTYRPLLEELRQVRAFISLTRKIFKSKGMSDSSIQQWREHLKIGGRRIAGLWEPCTMRCSAFMDFLRY